MLVLVCYDSLYQTVDILYITKENTIIEVYVTNVIRRFITKKTPTMWILDSSH